MVIQYILSKKKIHFQEYSLKFITVIVLLLFVFQTNTLFSRYHRKCRLFTGHTGKDIGSLLQERVLIYQQDYKFEPLITTRKQLKQTKFDYIYAKYLGSGNSGQVYLVEDLTNNKPKALKRFYKYRESLTKFEQQNFIMNKLNHTIEWSKDYENIITKNKYNSGLAENEYIISTLAFYPFQQSLETKNKLFSKEQASIIFYQALKQLQKAHKLSIIHNDIKVGNMLIKQKNSSSKILQMSIIDWNQASFYYKGIQNMNTNIASNFKSPQQVMKATYITPASDIWQLGITMFAIFCGNQTFYKERSKNNVFTLANIVGAQKIINMHRKYRYPVPQEYYHLLQIHSKNQTKYTAKGFIRLIPKDRIDLFTKDLIDIFERIFVVDPEQRITISQLLKHQFFKRIKTLPVMFQAKKKMLIKQAQQQKQKQKNSKNLINSINKPKNIRSG